MKKEIIKTILGLLLPIWLLLSYLNYKEITTFLPKKYGIDVLIVGNNYVGIEISFMLGTIIGVLAFWLLIVSVKQIVDLYHMFNKKNVNIV